MSLNQRLLQFQDKFITKNDPPRKGPSFRTRFLSLVGFRLLTEFLFITALIYIGQFFWLQNAGFLAIWPFVGVGLSALYLRGNAALLGIGAGCFFSYHFMHFAPILAIWFSLLLAGFLWLIRSISLRLIGPVAPLANRATLGAWLFVLIPFSFIYACLLIGAQVLYHLLPAFSGLWLIAYFFGVLNGILCLTPLCLAFDPFAIKNLFQKSAWRIWLGIGLLLFLTAPLFWLPPMWAILYAIFHGFCCTLFARKTDIIATGFSWLALSTIYMTASMPGLHVFQMRFTQSTSLILLALFTGFAMVSLIIAIPKQFSKNFAYTSI